MNYQERTLYGTLLADLLVYLLYLRHPASTNALGRIAGSVVILIVAQILVQSAIAVRTRSHLQDERDLLIRLKGYRAGYLTFVICIVVGLCFLWMHEAFGLINPQRMAIHFLSVMFGMLIVADVVRVVTQLIDYRRAA